MASPSTSRSEVSPSPPSERTLKISRESLDLDSQTPWDQHRETSSWSSTEAVVPVPCPKEEALRPLEGGALMPPEKRLISTSEAATERAHFNGPERALDQHQRCGLRSRRGGVVNGDPPRPASEGWQPRSIRIPLD